MNEQFQFIKKQSWLRIFEENALISKAADYFNAKMLHVLVDADDPVRYDFASHLHYYYGLKIRRR